MYRLVALLVLFFSTQAAIAWPFHGDGGAAPSVVLASATNTFGNKTKAGYGGERLSRTDQNYGAKYSPYGTGVLVSGSCAKWSTSVTSGTPSYWNLISHVAEGSTAVTPTLTATGVTNLAGGAGSHTDFLVSCEDASNNVLATSTLTYSINDGLNNCGALNIGSTDNTGVAFQPSGFGTTIDGCYVQMSTGYNKSGRFAIGMPFTKKVYLTFADPLRPGELQNIETGSNSTNVTMKDIMVLGSTTNGVGTAAFVLAGTNISGDNLHRYATATMRAAGSYQCVQTPGTASTPQTISNFGCEWVNGFFTPATNYTYSNGWSRFPGTDAIIVPGYIHDFHMNDMTVVSFTDAGVGVHPDVWQLSDGGTPSDYSVTRFMYIQAGGRTGGQGPFFGGGVSGIPTASAPAAWMGYVSDSGCTGAAGQTLCVTSAGGAQTNANGSLVFSLSGSPIGLSDNITINCGGTPCPFGVGSKYTLSGLAGNITYGSAGSPAQFYGVTNRNATWDMVWNSGYVIQGMFYSGSSGTSSASHLTHMYQTTSGQSPLGPPFLRFGSCAFPIYTGTLTVSKGAEYSQWGSDCTPTTAPPTNVTVTDVLNAASNSATLASWYVNGDPKTCLEAKSTADWDALTIQQAMVYAASCTIVKTGGPLDLGGGAVANATNASLTPQWADGTVVGTGFSGQ